MFRSIKDLYAEIRRSNKRVTRPKESQNLVENDQLTDEALEEVVAPDAAEIEKFSTEDLEAPDSWSRAEEVLSTYDDWSDILFAKHCFTNRVAAFHHTLTGSGSPAALKAVVTALGGKLVEATIPSSKDSTTGLKYLLNSGSIHLDIHDKNHNTDSQVFCRITLAIIGEDRFNFVNNCISPLLTKKVEASNTLFMFVATPRGMSTEEIGKITTPLVQENYCPQTVEQYQDLVAYLSGTSSERGKLALIDGLPGTGKSYLVRGLISEAKNISPILILPQSISDLSGPALLRCLLDHKNDYCQEDTRLLLIVEDADSCLLPRMSDNMDSVSSLLNLTDGIIGDALNVFILMTTNAKKPEIEPALMRAGRLSHTITVSALPTEQANNLYRKRGGDSDPYTSPTQLCDIYRDVHNLTSADVLKPENRPVPKVRGKVGF